MGLYREMAKVVQFLLDKILNPPKEHRSRDTWMNGGSTEGYTGSSRIRDHDRELLKILATDFWFVKLCRTWYFC